MLKRNTDNVQFPSPLALSVTPHELLAHRLGYICTCSYKCRSGKMWKLYNYLRNQARLILSSANTSGYMSEFRTCLRLSVWDCRKQQDKNNTHHLLSHVTTHRHSVYNVTVNVLTNIRQTWAQSCLFIVYSIELFYLLSLLFRPRFLTKFLEKNRFLLNAHLFTVHHLVTKTAQIIFQFFFISAVVNTHTEGFTRGRARLWTSSCVCWPVKKQGFSPTHSRSYEASFAVW